MRAVIKFWGFLKYCKIAFMLQILGILLVENRLSLCEMLGENKNLIFICMKASSGNVAKSQFSLESFKVPFECL